ncbi:MAG: RNA polymerase sigma-70 factor [Dysgonamonadaceae bacterium]|jgi:RNA polymerase sigma-70 factor (ECF subfamily)|nr:RNA polymerase sigma-70 factor [Dysgonamonadaceae bacterium]
MQSTVTDNSSVASGLQKPEDQAVTPHPPQIRPIYCKSVDYKDFSEIYLLYCPRLTMFAKEYVIAFEDAENIVQDVFLFLWENKKILPSVQNLNAYLFALIRNRCIDFLRGKTSEKTRNENMQDLFESELKLKLDSLTFFDTNLLSDEKIEEIITVAINALPKKCREIFMLSRFDGLKYKEIAKKLDISINTVENQMSIALRKLKISLKQYLPLYFFWGILY